MALVAWYKLDGNALDSSGNKNHGTASGVTWTRGKIGQGRSDGYITIPNNPSLQIIGSMTISFWIYINSMSARRTVIDKAYGGEYTINLEPSGCLRIYAGKYGGNGSPYSSVDSEPLTLGRWYHATIVRQSDGSCTWYINGNFSTSCGANTNLVGSTSSSSVRIGTGYTGGNVDAIIDDVRIYNHTLSEKEVKELAKAKILHYKFDDFQEPTKNCVSNTDFENGWSDYVTGSSTGTTSFRIDPIYGKVMRLTKTDSGSGRYGRRCALSGMFGSVYTHSIYVRKLSGAGRIACMYVDASKSGGGLCVASNYKMLSSLPVGEWVRVAHSQDFSPDTLAGGGYAYVWIDSGSGDCEFALPQIECKPYATPFTPNERGGMVYDCSGYDYHAKLSLEETPEWVEDPEMGGSYRFNGSQSIKLNDSLPSPPDQVTVLAWVKTDDASAYQHVFSKGVNTISCAIYQSKMYCKFNIGGVNRNPKGNTVLQSNRWYHLVWLYDGTNIKFYIDGKLDMTSPTYTGQIREDDATTIIGAEFSTYPMNMMKGLISDVRVYATALSDDDIKELYQTRAALDSHGNLWVT